MTVSLCPVPKMQFLKDSGGPASGYCLYTYYAGQPGVQKATYTDSTGNTANTNPVVMDASGRASIWLNGYYCMELWTGVQGVDGSTKVWSQDNVAGPGYDAVIADVYRYFEIYQGPLASSPGYRVDGTPLQVGDMYFNTVTKLMYVYTGGEWFTTLPLPDIRTSSYGGDFDVALAVAAAAPTKTLIVDSDVSVTVSKTINNVSLVMQYPHKITVTTGQVLLMSCPFSSPMYQCFSGSVSFNGGYITEVYPEWWGAKGDGTTDDTQAFLQADMAQKIVCLSRGTYKLAGAVAPLFPKGLKFINSAMLLNNISSVPLIIYGPLQADLKQIFSGSSTGTVTFGAGSVVRTYPQWWGNTYNAVVSPGASTTLDLSAQYAPLTLVNLNATTVAITTITMPTTIPIDGSQYTIRFKQGATSVSTLAGWPGTVKLTGGAFTLTATINKSDAITFAYSVNDSTWYEISRSMNM